MSAVIEFFLSIQAQKSEFYSSCASWALHCTISGANRLSKNEKSKAEKASEVPR